MFYKLSDKGKTKKDYKQNSRNKFQIIIIGTKKTGCRSHIPKHSVQSKFLMAARGLGSTLPSVVDENRRKKDGL